MNAASARPVGVVGAGAFGRAVALAARRNGCDVLVWSRGRAVEGVTCTNDWARLSDAGLIFIAVPSTHIELAAEQLSGHLDGSHFLVHLSRGLSGPELRPLSGLLSRLTPCRRVGVLAGPLVPSELERGSPAAAIVGSRFPDVIEAVRRSIGRGALHVFGTSDVTGVEIASALMGIFAFIVGYIGGLGFGPGARAVVAARGVIEAARIGMSLGAKERTFSGLAGVGDLMSAMCSEERLEVALGRAIGAGTEVAEATRDAGAYFEGLAVARHVAAYAERARVPAPILQVVHRVLTGQITSEVAFRRLLSEAPPSEW